MSKHLPLEVITQATYGDADAVAKVIAHYSSYISYLARRYGNYDVEASCRMESKLVEALLKFRLD